MTSTSLRRLAVALIGGCSAALLLALGLTSAESSESLSLKRAFNTNVNITGVEPDQVTGNVRSTRDACERGRLVKLFYVVPGQPRPEPRSGPPSSNEREFKLGQDRTNRKGKWAVEGDFFIGEYRATTAGKRLGGGGGGNKKAKLEETLEEVEDEDLRASRKGGRGGGGDRCRRGDSETEHGPDD